MTTHDDGGDTVMEDRELRALFAPRRPDAERFRAGVAERLRRAGGGGSGTVAAPRTDGVWRERAASMLPALPPGTSFGSTLGAWLSLPALLVVGCLAAFWRGDRSLVAAMRGARSRMPRRQPSGVRRTFWQRNAKWLRAGLAGVAIGVLGWFVDLPALENTVLAVLLASMIVLVGQIGSLAAHHGAPTEAVGACVSDLLGAALFGGLVWNMASDGGMTLGAALGWWVLAWGTTVVQCLRYWRSRRFVLTAFWGLFALGICSLFVPGLLAPKGTAALREELARATPDGADGQHWRALELCGEALRAAGEPVPDLTNLRLHLANVIAAQPGPWPETWSAGARLGLITEEQWQAIERTEYVAYHMRRLLLDRGRFNFFGHDRYQLELLLATGELSEDEREHLVLRIEQSWPKLDAPNPGVDVGLALLCVQWLDRLGRSDLVTPRVPQLRELLASLWVAPGAANSSRGAGGFAARAGERAWLPDTTNAVELMVRIGPPPEIDVSALRRFLRWHVGRGGYGVQAFACLALLDAGPHTPPRSVWQWFLDERLFVGSLLLVVLALRAVWFTRPLGAVGRGALP